MAIVFQRGKIDKTIFIKRYKGDILLVQVYVDDIIFGSTKKELCDAFEKLMHEKFQMSSMGELTFFLGLQVKQKKDVIFISQDKYVGEISKKVGFTKVKTASTPIETQKPLLKDENGEEVNVHMYRYQVNPKVSHLHAVKRIFRYLKGQPKLGLWYPKDSPFDLVAYTDIDYVRASLDRKSTIGVQLHALVDGKRIIIIETSVRRTVKCLSPKTTVWNEFSSTMASAIICLATNQKFNFSKLIFDSMVRNLDNLSGKFLTYLRKPKRKDTQVPQPSDAMEIVADEAVHKELGDSLVRAATTASSLEVKQDSGNINKTQSKATPNESSSQGANSGGGPRCQETMGDTITQTRFERVSKQSNDSLLARGNTLRSYEDRLKLEELMALFTNLQTRVLNLEQTKTSQHNEIASLKRRVKKLEKKDRSRTHKLKRLYKVGLTARVDSSGNEESLGEDASKQGRINAIDADEDITLVSVHDMNVSADEEVGEEDVVEVITTAKLIIDAAQVSAAGDKVCTAGAATTVSATTTTADDLTLAQALQEMKSTKPKLKGVVIQEPGESTTTISSQQLQGKNQSQDKGKGILDGIQEKVDVDYQLAERLQAKKQEQFTIEEKATLFKEFLEQRRKHFAAKRAEEKRNKPLTKSQQIKIMCNYLNNMEGYKLKDLNSKGFDSIQEMFDRAFKRVNTFEDFRIELVEGKEKRAGVELVQESAKKQKVDDDKDTAEIKKLMEVIPEEEEEVTIDVILVAVKSLTDEKSQMYMIFGHMLKSFDREDLENLYKMVKAKYESTRPVEDLDVVLWNDLNTMFEPHVKDAVWKNQQDYKVLSWKLYDSCRVHFLRMQHVYIYMLVEKKHPLTPSTLTMMLEKKLEIDYESKMAY
ncbi:uncharacterized mitochondrial protein-like protein [Tanacetum coccineum]|uniref:Uncharacterized mitochondrial protein-like protein n=1 Tax=Tanacetum coccineum TaxID=301880 RepID=A0ABQ4ZJ02_9ASTR